MMDRDTEIKFDPDLFVVKKKTLPCVCSKCWKFGISELLSAENRQIEIKKMRYRISLPLKRGTIVHLVSSGIKEKFYLKGMQKARANFLFGANHPCTDTRRK